MKKPVYKVIKGFDMNDTVKRQVSAKGSISSSIESFYANKNVFSTLKPKDIAQPVGKVFRG